MSRLSDPLNPSRSHGWRRWTAALAALALGSALLPWAWNTLAALWNGPQVGAREALAALVVLATGRALLLGTHRGRGCEHARGETAS